MSPGAASLLVPRDLDVHDEAPVERHHEPQARWASTSKRPDDRRRPLEDPDDAPFGAVVAHRSTRATTRSPCIAWLSCCRR
jgi:hypothetical protein